MSDARDKILTEACELYLKDGLDGFSMRKLAKQVGVTAPALYRHYDGKEAVLADVLREAFQTFTRYLYRALSAPTPLERFFGAGEGYLDFVIEHPRWHAILSLGPDALGMSAMPEDVASLGQGVHQFWIDRVRECMEAGILKRDDPEKVSMAMWAHAHGMTQLYRQGHCAVSEEEFRALFEESGARLFAGVGTPEFAARMQERYELGRAEPAPAPQS